MHTKLLTYAAFFLTAATATVRAEALKIYSVDAPPMTMDNPSQRGFVAEITLEALKRAGYDAEMIFIPWKRGQQEVAEGENLLIIPFSRTSAREANYTWIAPIFKLERSFAAIGKSIDSYDQAKAELKSVIVGQGSAQEELLKAAGFTASQMRIVKIGQKETDLLSPQGEDAWFNGTPETLWRWKQAGRTETLVVGKAIDANDIYLACSLKCSPRIVERLQAAVAALEADGTLQRVMDKYLR